MFRRALDIFELRTVVKGQSDQDRHSEQLTTKIRVASGSGSTMSSATACFAASCAEWAVEVAEYSVLMLALVRMLDDGVRGGVRREWG